MGVQGTRALRASFATCAFAAAALAVYWAHARWFRVDVVFYAALLDVILAAAACALVLWRASWFSCLDAMHKGLLLLVWLLAGYAFAISVPTVIDRSLSFYLLEKLDQRGGGIRADAMQRVIDDEFMDEYRVLDARLTEQVESGTIRIVDGCVLLTERGRHTAAFSRFVRNHLLPRRRQLLGDYSDALTHPLGDGQAIAGYSCGPGTADPARAPG